MTWLLEEDYPRVDGSAKKKCNDRTNPRTSEHPCHPAAERCRCFPQCCDKTGLDNFPVRMGTVRRSRGSTSNTSREAINHHFGTRGLVLTRVNNVRYQCRHRHSISSQLLSTDCPPRSLRQGISCRGRPQTRPHSCANTFNYPRTCSDCADGCTGIRGVFSNQPARTVHR